MSQYKNDLKERRMKGEFYTHPTWVVEAHKMIEESLGEDWKDEYVVWDCACGTGNLTNGQEFKELYISTLDQRDIDEIDENKQNEKSVRFQFDFLNDDIFDNGLFDQKTKVPIELQNALSDGKKILFLINPPYGTAVVAGATVKSKAGISKTKTNTRMLKEKWGKASSNLYAQFLYRICKLNNNENITIAVFSPPSYKTNISYKPFRKQFFSKFCFDNGMLFSAGHFSDTVNYWGIDFSILKSGSDDRDEFPMTLKDTKDGKIVTIGDKLLYNVDNHTPASAWVREGVKGVKIDMPKLSSALKVKDCGRGRGGEDSIGYLQTNSNNVYKNGTEVALYSSDFSGGNGVDVVGSLLSMENNVDKNNLGTLNNHSNNVDKNGTDIFITSSVSSGNANVYALPENFRKVCNLFTARKSIKGNWINDKDEYFAPNESHPDYEQFSIDSIVYALFNNSSQQSSLRDITYRGEKWDIKNEWFFMSREEIMTLAKEYEYDAIYQDADKSHDRFVYNKLNEVYDKLSPLAKEVLNNARELTRKSFESRKILSEQHPEYHLDSWDSSYAQLKLVWKISFADEFKEFRANYKKFEDAIIPKVYDVGFLK
jgi:predicted RNA methylase